MFVDTCKSGKYKRVLLRTSYRENGKVKHKTVGNLTGCTEEEIEAVKLALRHKDDLTNLGNIREDVQASQGRRFGDIWLVYQKARELGIEKALGKSRQGKLALWQVIARVIDQGSRLSAVRLAANSATGDILDFAKGFCEDDLYRNLEWMSDNQSNIEKKLFRRQDNSGEQYYLYDVTSCYLEGMDNHFAAFGYNRDGKKGKRQITIGLLCDGNGIPVSVEVFQGNTSDMSTVSSQLNKLAEDFGAENIALVGDRGMIKAPQIDDITSETYRFNYITALDKKEINTLLKDETLQMELFDEKLTEVIEGGVRYILRRNPERKADIEKNRTEKIAAVNRYIEQQNQYLIEHPKAWTEVAERRIREKIEKLNIADFLRIEKNGKRQFTYSIDKDTLQKTAKLDGCYVIKTDIERADADKDEIHNRYKDLAKVEWAFRTSKKEVLEMQPVHVRTEKSTRGHVFVIMMAYMITQALRQEWQNLDITVPEGLDALSSLCTVGVSITEAAKCNKLPQPNEMTRKLLDAANVTLPEAIPRKNIKIDTRHKLRNNS